MGVGKQYIDLRSGMYGSIQGSALLDYKSSEIGKGDSRGRGMERGRDEKRR